MTTLLVKTEGAGNDFLVGTGDWARRLAEDEDLVVRLCDRRRGIGADGVLALCLESPSRIRLVHRNADGSRTAFCANGTRCAARVAVERLGCESSLEIVTGWTTIDARVRSDSVALSLPAPPAPESITLATDRGPRSGTLLTVGVPHFVIRRSEFGDTDIGSEAAELRHHPGLGKAGANIHVVNLNDIGELVIRSFERGVSEEVLCCGSGVVASALVTMAASDRRDLTVRPRSGDELRVEAIDPPPQSASRLTGPARLVAEIEPL